MSQGGLKSTDAEGATNVEDSNWKSPQLRQMVVQKIFDFFIKLVRPVDGEDRLSKMEAAAKSMEEKIFSSSTDKEDYFKKISEKLKNIRNKQGQVPSPQSASVSHPHQHHEQYSSPSPSSSIASGKGKLSSVSANNQKQLHETSPQGAAPENREKPLKLQDELQNQFKQQQEHQQQQEQQQQYQYQHQPQSARLQHYPCQSVLQVSATRPNEKKSIPFSKDLKNQHSSSPQTSHSMLNKHPQTVLRQPKQSNLTASHQIKSAIQEKKLLPPQKQPLLEGNKFTITNSQQNPTIRLQSSIPVTQKQELMRLQCEPSKFQNLDKQQSQLLQDKNLSTHQLQIDENIGDWQEEVYQKVQGLNYKYLNRLSFTYAYARRQLKQLLHEGTNSTEIEKYGALLNKLEEIFKQLRVSKTHITLGFDLDQLERRIVRILKAVHIQRMPFLSHNQGQDSGDHSMQQSNNATTPSEPFVIYTPMMTTSPLLHDLSQTAPPPSVPLDISTPMMTMTTSPLLLEESQQYICDLSQTAPPQSIPVISTPMMTMTTSPLLEEQQVSCDFNQTTSDESIAVEQPIDRLIRLVNTMSPQALRASVSDIESVVYMADRIPGPAPELLSGLRAWQYRDDPPSRAPKMRRFFEATPL